MTPLDFKSRVGSFATLAKLLGYSARGHIYRVCTGQQIPSLDLAVRFYVASEGRVTLRDWMALYGQQLLSLNLLTSRQYDVLMTGPDDDDKRPRPPRKEQR